jgi:hypothetical protein
LSGYSEITVYIYLESYPGVEATVATTAKLAIEGDDGTIWQTLSVKAEKPPVDSSYRLRFKLSPSDMERVEGKGRFRNVVSNVNSIRLRFENTRNPGFRQDAYIDSITAVQ